MADAFYVWIRLNKLAASLINDDGFEWTVIKANSWLQERDFIEQQNGSFLCKEISLDVLHESEVSAKRLMD